MAKHSLGNKNDACLDWSKSGELGNADDYDFIKNIVMIKYLRPPEYLTKMIDINRPDRFQKPVRSINF